jgi:chromosome partitioning protein
VTRVVTLLNQKGGVGKSTLTMNLAAVRAEQLSADRPPEAPSPVAVVSIDPQGSAEWWAARMKSIPFHLIQAHDDPLEWLAALNQLPGISEVYVDTAGWYNPTSNTGGDGLGDSYTADVLRTVLSVTDLVVVPVVVEPLALDPAARTISKLLDPQGIPYMVLLNNWDPRDGRRWVTETQEFAKAANLRLASTVVRRFKVHTNASAAGVVVTQYERNRKNTDAIEDFYTLADEVSAALLAGVPA